MPKTFKASEIVGKTLYNSKPVLFYRSLTEKGKSIKAGTKLGPVYSWIEWKDGNLYWMFLDDKKKPWYIKHDEGAFDIESLRDQGVKTTKEREEEKNPPSKFEILFKKYGVPILIGIGAIIIITKRK
jgi:hypothetical protein